MFPQIDLSTKKANTKDQKDWTFYWFFLKFADFSIEMYCARARLYVQFDEEFIIPTIRMVSNNNNIIKNIALTWS